MAFNFTVNYSWTWQMRKYVTIVGVLFFLIRYLVDAS